MSLKIEKLILNNFRGYSHLTLDEMGQLNVLVGPNAVGKTNIVEAIQLLTEANSFKKPSWSETISWGSDAAYLRADFYDDKRSMSHELNIVGNERTYKVNGKKKSPSQVRGTCSCVLFIPDHLQMIKTSSAVRRATLDDLGCQLSKTYAQIKNDYVQALKQRNLLIKEEIHSGALFESWDESVAIYGARLYLNRKKLFTRLSKIMRETYSTVVDGEQLDTVYIPSWERFDEGCRQKGDVVDYEPADEDEEGLEIIQERLISESHRLADAEIRRKVSLIGPHKDEISFFVNGRNLRVFGSQGQQRTLVLIWKIAELSLIEEVTGQKPILLLDDVMSELDSAHRESLTSFISDAVQTFITTTNIDYFSEDLIDKANVLHLPIEGTRHVY